MFEKNLIIQVDDSITMYKHKITQFLDKNEKDFQD